MNDFEVLPVGTAARLAQLEDENERLRKATQLCDKHAPNGGTVSACVVCSGQKLSYALSRISYLCEPPNEMECSSYDLHYNEDAVVAQVERLRDSCAAKADRIDRLGETVGRLTGDLQRAYRCIQGMHNAIAHGTSFPAEAYHAATIAAAKRFVWEDALDGAGYFTGKPVAVLHEALALPEAMHKEGQR